MKCPNCNIELKAKKGYFNCLKCGFEKPTKEEDKKTIKEIKEAGFGRFLTKK